LQYRQRSAGIMSNAHALNISNMLHRLVKILFDSSDL
jgi:hypothetical protein